MMRFCVLGSGSKGNATYIEGGNTRILIDAGFSGVEVERRLYSVGVDPTSIDAIVVSHEHGDHIKGVQVLSRRYGLTVLASRLTKQAAGKSLAKVYDWVEIAGGQKIFFKELAVHPFSISHDVVDPLGFVISHGNLSVGYCTDTGKVSRLMQHRLSGCNGLVLECNHDPVMLKNGKYPPPLQQRIRSNDGHLANIDAAGFLADLVHEKLEHVVLAHLSESNNTEKIARQEVENFLAGNLPGGLLNGDFAMTVALQDQAGEMIYLKDDALVAGKEV